MMVAPMLASSASTTAELSFTSPPSMPCGTRHAANGKIHSCSYSPPRPSGAFTLWFGPATKPWSEMEILNRSFDIYAPVQSTATRGFDFCDVDLTHLHHRVEHADYGGRVGDGDRF